MATRYTKPTLSGYDANSPPDDGTQTPSNEITWAKHKTKLADPLKTYIDAINTDVAAVLNDNNTTLVDQWPISLSDAAYDSATRITATLHTDKFGNTRPVSGDRIVATGSSTGTIFGTVDSVSGSGPATINITWDSGSLSNEALTVWVGIVTQPSLPAAFVVDSIANLQARTGPASSSVYVLGYYGEGTPGGGVFILDPDDSSTSDNGGSVIVDSDGLRWKRPNTSGVIDAQEWGCKRSEDDGVFDNATRLAAISSEINQAATVDAFRAVEFAPGIYNTSGTFSITADHITLRGRGSNRGALSFSPDTSSGARLQYTGSTGGPLVDVDNGANGTVLFAFRAENVSFGADSGLATDPVLLRMVECSEYSMHSVGWNGGGAGTLLKFEGVNIGVISDYYMADADYQVDVAPENASAAVPLLATCWFEHGNHWISKEATVRIKEGQLTQLVFSDTWFERSKTFIKPVQGSDVVTTWSKVQFNSCSFVQDSTYTTAGVAWLIQSDAFSGGSNQALLQDVTFNDCRITFTASSPEMIKYTKDTNSSGNSYMERLTFNDCNIANFTGTLTTSDTASSSVFVFSTVKPSGATWAAGSMQYSEIRKDFANVGFFGSSPEFNTALRLADGITVPSTVSGWAHLYVDTSDGDLKVKFGDGTVKTIATDT